jgi:hypothetical protein
MKRILLVALLGCGCASTNAVVARGGDWTARDYVKTALQTLTLADTDTGGHRMKAELETRAALDILDARGHARAVPYEGPPTLAAALELLQQGELSLMRTPSPALDHTRRAEAELREALAIK